MKRLLSGVLFVFFCTLNVSAHDPDFLRSTGKIYGVYAVILVLFIVLALYLFSIDRKITRIEKSLDDE